MPTTQSTTYAAQVAAAANFTARIDDKRFVSGAVQTAFITVPVTADNVATNVVTLIELPPGSIVLPELSSIVVTDDFTSGACTIDIGDSGDPDRYCDGANCAAVGVQTFLSAAPKPRGITHRQGTAATAAATQPGNVVTATFATLGATVAAGAFNVVLAYKSL